MALRIFVTGGTFDKEYNELTGELFFKKTHLQEILKQGRCRLSVKITTLMLKDSLFMTEADRKVILKAVQNCPETEIVITHGTDTMEKTAMFLGGKIKNKTVILTGAMIPYKFGSSDGIFNLSSALSFAQALPYGTFVAMNGKLFSFDNVTKNRKLGVFENKK